VTALSLLGMAVVLMIGGAQLRRVQLFDSAPRLGVLAWQVQSFAALSSVVLAGLTLVVPSSELGHSLSSFLRACVYTVQAAYAAPTQFPAVTGGLLLSAAATVWPAGWVTAQLVVARRERCRTRDALALVSRDDRALGATSSRQMSRPPTAFRAGTAGSCSRPAPSRPWTPTSSRP
jgi:hypothetical protein